MEDFVEAFQNKHPGIRVEEHSEFELLEDAEGNEEEVEVVRHDITVIPNLDGLTLRLRGEAEFQRLDNILASKPMLFRDILGGKVGGNVEVVLTRISGHANPIYFLSRMKGQPIKASIAYQSKALEVEIHLASFYKTEIGFLATKMVGILSQRTGAIAKISGLPTATATELESDTRLVLRSVLFDVECSYGIGFETANLENLKTPANQPRRLKLNLPIEPITLLYKPYTAELIEYFHTGEKVDHLPFKFICYFHIIEYFMDKSAHRVVAKKIKQIIMSPDFHAKSSEYISEAIKVFKSETEKFMTDKIKITRVLAEYLNKDSLSKYLETNALYSHFEKDHTLKCGKDLKICGLKFDSEHSFFETLTRRIYSIRCSIVHSNPDFDESIAVPFSSTPQNLDFLRKEIELVKEVARTIIVVSSIV